MKKLAILTFLLALLLLAGCGGRLTLCASIPANNRMIVRDDTVLTVKDGSVTVRNRSDADASCYAYMGEEKTASSSVEVPAKGKAELSGLTPGDYRFGVGAQVSEETEIELILSP